jgi:hypothetical protein
MPHFDVEKVFGLFTEAEAKRARRLIRDKKGGALRSMIVAAMRRAEHMPLSAFVGQKRERIVLGGGSQ